ncbi:DNA helicase UvrD [Virgibacillus profundi]|uniref:DNA 3'-5' helicase n=1 Tax=Virgibacillus profundi TaxID=2024555 RepID=A0A2A2IFV8_9BACI|nr:ATP-dependent helicase [Virgibacillus profundi]PAV30196.1 DNA helicase UvrD [Virgibacillus profundi]PXY54368.1 ATP-dependent helicase [Virgibacillus profundi]
MTKINFNPEQQVAVDHFDGAMGVISSAGSGKSTILLGRIDKLIREHNIPEKSILAISFTKNTASELQSKLKAMNHKFVNVGTFHAICGRILYQEGIQITGYNMIKEWQVDNCFKNIDKNADTKEITNYISFQKNFMVSYDDEFIKKESDYTIKELRKFYKAYEDLKKQKKLYDFDDYLLLCLEVVKNNPDKYTYDYILVDEHQDSNLVQNHLLKEWCQTGNIFTLSDYRQAIFEFRGGTTEYSMNFDKYWKDATIHNVFTNYRSPKNIVEQSNHFIRQYYSDYEHYVDAKAHNQEDGHIEVNSHFSRDVEGVEVADKIEQLIEDGEKLNEIAVLYRMNAHADFVEAELKRRKIDYEIANDSSFFKRKEVAGILAILRLVHNPQDDNAFEGAFKARNYPLTYMSNKIFNDMQNYATKHNTSMLDAATDMPYSQMWQKKNITVFKKIINNLRKMNEDGANVISLIAHITKSTKLEETIKEKYRNKEEIDERLNSIEVLKSFVKGNNLEQFITYVYSSFTKKKSKKDAVKLMSIHRSKGLEFDNVFVVGVENDKFPHHLSSLEEEARLFYVSCTRSKKNLFISEIGRNTRFIVEYGMESNSSKQNGDQHVISNVDEWIKNNF